MLCRNGALDVISSWDLEVMMHAWQALILAFITAACSPIYAQHEQPSSRPFWPQHDSEHSFPIVHSWIMQMATVSAFKQLMVIEDTTDVLTAMGSTLCLLLVPGFLLCCLLHMTDMAASVQEQNDHMTEWQDKQAKQQESS